MTDAAKMNDMIEQVYILTPETTLRIFSGNLASMGYLMLSQASDKLVPAILAFKKMLEEWITNHPKVHKMQFRSYFRGEERIETGYAAEIGHTELVSKLHEMIRHPDIKVWNEPDDFYFIDLDALEQNIIYQLKQEEIT